MKAPIIFVVLFLFGPIATRAQEPSPSSAEPVSTSDIPKDYELGNEDERIISPDGRFAVLFPVRSEEGDKENGPAYPPNLLVRLKPYAVLAKVRKAGLPLGWRDKLRAEWNGNGVVAIWEDGKWGILDLSVYEIENDKLKRAHPVFREALKYFVRDFHQRFLKKYPKESDNFIFVGDSGQSDFEFAGRQLSLNLFADNKPNLAGGPHWTAELHAIWNLDTGKFEKIDFRPGKIEVRPWLE